jgi:GT2 family glycosyltransferase
MSQQDSPKVSIIIPVLHWKRPLNKKRFFMPRQTIEETLRDIKKNVQLSYEVIVVCNGQDPELIEFIKTSPDVDKYCINYVNVGVARAWNMGAQLAEGEFLCYLNDDVSVGQNSLETLLKHFNNPLVGEVGPEGSYWRECAHHSFADSKEPIVTDVVSGFCFLVRSSVFHKLGGFDIAYSPAGCEEIDFSYRIRQAGLQCLVDPTVNIKHFHHHSVSSQKIDIHYLSKTIDTEALHLRNTEYFRKKWAGVFP